MSVSLSDDRGRCWLVAVHGLVNLVLEPPDETLLHLRRVSGGSIFGLLPTNGNGAEFADQVMVSRSSGSERPHPPFDVEAESDRAAIMPAVDLTIQFECFDSPMGDLRFTEQFVDGLMARRCAGVLDQPDVTVTATFALLMRGYDPHITSLEAITGMHVTGQDRTLLMVVAGLYDDRRFRHRLWRRHREQSALVDLASHTTTEEWRHATEKLR